MKEFEQYMEAVMEDPIVALMLLGIGAIVFFGTMISWSLLIRKPNKE
jgi:hypothetical protein